MQPRLSSATRSVFVDLVVDDRMSRLQRVIGARTLNGRNPHEVPSVIANQHMPIVVDAAYAVGTGTCRVRFTQKSPLVAEDLAPA